jgi:hypothetical protein
MTPHAGRRDLRRRSDGAVTNRKSPTQRSILGSLEVSLVRTVNGWKVSNASGDVPPPTS